jgi:hypothetical protein
MLARVVSPELDHLDALIAHLVASNRRWFERIADFDLAGARVELDLVKLIEQRIAALA